MRCRPLAACVFVVLAAVSGVAGQDGFFGILIEVATPPGAVVVSDVSISRAVESAQTFTESTSMILAKPVPTSVQSSTCTRVAGSNDSSLTPRRSPGRVAPSGGMHLALLGRWARQGHVLQCDT